MTGIKRTTCFTLRKVALSSRSKEILKDIDLDLYSGKFYGLVGPNGSGKTSLIRVLSGTIQPDRGTVELFGKGVNNYRKKALARHLALVPQEFSLGFEFLVRDVVFMGRHPHVGRFRLPLPIDEEIVDQAMTDMDIVSLAKRFVTQLSGGEKQRVVVARALAQDTPVLLLDEATSSLDIRHSLEIMQNIRKRVLQRDTCVVGAIHDLNLAAAFCDELIVIQDGKLICCGPVEDVLNRDLIGRVFEVGAEVTHCPRHGSLRIDFFYNQPGSGVS